MTEHSRDLSAEPHHQPGRAASTAARWALSIRACAAGPAHVPKHYSPTARLDLVDEVRAVLDAGVPRPDGYNVGFNAGAAAGQTVGHLHVHVIPRYRGHVENPTGVVRGCDT